VGIENIGIRSEYSLSASFMEKSRSSGSYSFVQPSDRLVYLVTDDVPFSDHISQQIIHFGYVVQHIRDLKSFPYVSADQKPVAIIIDIPVNEEQMIPPEFWHEISGFPQTAQNLIFTSGLDDQTVRLKSIQMGGVAFFTKPTNIVGLVDKLDALDKNASKQQPSKVLIVEDQNAVASYYQMILKMAGLDVQIVSNPEHVLEQMREFHPDLILLDTYLTGIHAAELAKAIRQMEDYVSIPIIFLSSEDDFAKRIEALDLGGDDFLVKPIKASHLVAVVRSRLDRSRTLRSYMVRDSLTNLFNHTAFRNLLSHEVIRTKRQNSTIALAMLDIDHFKTVNDTYGHAAGDSAIKGLARLLQQRLRRSDIIGRYGGDEFVALLIDCEAEKAVKVMDEIRVHFSEIEFYPNRVKSLYLTFSCGIATFPPHHSAESLTDSADQALYLAKAGQRNRVVIAPST
jgi:diguanylate cyclase (GGDEF)-like protein